MGLLGPGDDGVRAEMERRKALVLSVVATLMVLAMAGMAVSLVRMTLDSDERATPTQVVAAADGDPASASTNTEGATTPLDPVVTYLDVYEVVPGSSASSGPGIGASPPGGGAPPPSGSTATPASPSPAVAVSTSPLPAPTTTSPTPAPTTPAPTTTVEPRPPGVPSDWPTGKPIPPMPVDCREPQLEDNGVWNCQH
jgi:hypothetical protein